MSWVHLGGTYPEIGFTNETLGLRKLFKNGKERADGIHSWAYLLSNSPIEKMTALENESIDLCEELV